MFDVGFTELLLIGIVALVVIGPERLPAVARTAGQWIGKLQRFVRGVKTDLASELESGDLKKLIGDQREQINELKEMVHTAKKDFETTSQQAVQGARKNLKQMETSVNEAGESGSNDVTQTDSAMPTATSTTRSQSAVTSNEQTDARSSASTDGGAPAANNASSRSDGMDRTGTESGN